MGTAANRRDLRLKYDTTLEERPSEPEYVGNFGAAYAGEMPVQHMWGAAKFQMTPTGNSMQVELMIRSDDVKLALPRILGYAEDSLSGNTLTRVLPIRDPIGFGMIATGVSGEFAYPSGVEPNQVDPETENAQYIDPDPGLWGSGDGAIYPPDFDRPTDERHRLRAMSRYVRGAVTFEHVPYDIQPDSVAIASPIEEQCRFTFARLIPGIEYLSLERGTVKWSETGAGGPTVNEQIGGGAGITTPIHDIHVTWYSVPLQVVASLNRLWTKARTATENPVMGAVNDAAFKLALYGEVVEYAAETLLCMSPKITLRYVATGMPMYDVEYQFMFRPSGWNKFLYINNFQFYRVVTFNNDMVYRTFDFKKLFRAESN